ncbi:MAG: DUF721 domain-containing protein [Spirochaetaceae bacterium]|jgi:hypothetical protein|nr:DUF721 domain-containing protein [Spirochaetaceae bacterium]
MKKAGEVLSVLFNKESLHRARGYAGLFASWEEVARSCGISRAASHSRIAALDRGVVRVEADHPGWVQVLQAKQRLLLQEARQRFPELGISGMVFRLSRSRLFPPAPPVPERAGLDASFKEAGGPSAALDERIQDEGLKKILRRLEQHLTHP